MSMKSQRPRVILEPDLQAEVELFSWQARLHLARKLERWAHQLRVSAKIIQRDLPPPPSPPSLKPLCAAKLRLN